MALWYYVMRLTVCFLIDPSVRSSCKSWFRLGSSVFYLLPQIIWACLRIGWRTVCQWQTVWLCVILLGSESELWLRPRASFRVSVQPCQGLGDHRLILLIWGRENVISAAEKKASFSLGQNNEKDFEISDLLVLWSSPLCVLCWLLWELLSWDD